MPIASRTEVEAKFEVPDAPAFEKLLSLEALGEWRLVPAGEQRITDRYFDTAGRDLMRGGYAFRRRTGDAGGSEVVAVKGLGRAHGAVHQRPEHEMEVPPGTAPERWPAGPARDIVLERARGSPLVELLTVRQHRSVRGVERDGRRVAALSLDRIELGDRGAPEAYELEVELAPDGTVAELRALSKLLRGLGLRPQPRSKFEGALALLDPEEPGPPPAFVRERATRRTAGASRRRPAAGAGGARKRSRTAPMGVLADDPMAEAGRKILRHHRDQMLAHEAGTIAGSDPEELHDMRVATRRQRAALRILRPYFRRKAIRPVRDGLRTLGGSLGSVRDLDVLLAAARAYQSSLAAADAGAFQGVLDAWTRRDDAARRRMLEHLGGNAYAEFKQSYGAFLDAPGAGARVSASGETPRPALVAHVLRSELWAGYGRVCAFEALLPAAPVGALHELRIAGKRLRYLLEFFREVLHPCVAEAIEAMVALQDHLGELQDAVVTIGHLREFLAGPDATAVPGAATAAGRYLDSRQARIEELRRTLDRPWKAVSGSAFKSCLSRAVAKL
ncbi:MAG TPA: CHAD domain-containing protein [Candidatus Eisenbacteria bacterium]|jgi:CHAD domain-containing protein